MRADATPAPIDVRWRASDELGSALALARACGGDASRGVAVRSSDGFASARALWRVYDVVSMIDPRRAVHPVFERRGVEEDVATRADDGERDEEDERTRADDADSELERAVRARVASWTARDDAMDERAPRGTMDAVSVGGTFDRLHAGHRLLLATASRAVASGGVLYVGVTSAELLANKAYGALVESYADRAASARAFLALCDPESSIELRVGSARRVAAARGDGSRHVRPRRQPRDRGRGRGAERHASRALVSRPCASSSSISCAAARARRSS